MKGKSRWGLLLPVAAAMVALAAMAPVAQAAKPAPGYEQYAGCPSLAENPKIIGCIHSVVTGGNFKMGNKNVPITNPITLTGGVGVGLSGFSYNKEGGMKPVKQQVPGGVIGLTGLDWLVNFLDIDSLQLFAVTELAGTPTLGFTDLGLPIKVHLINPVLGKNCYVGSNSSPIMLNLTTGTTSPPPPNKPISGEGPLVEEEPVKEIITLKSKYVDNSFAAPGANGCTLTLLGIIPFSLNGLVNAASGLPAAAGTNETVQSITTNLAPVGGVYP